MNLRSTLLHHCGSLRIIVCAVVGAKQNSPKQRCPQPTPVHSVLTNASDPDLFDEIAAPIGCPLNGDRRCWRTTLHGRMATRGFSPEVPPDVAISNQGLAKKQQAEHCRVNSGFFLDSADAIMIRLSVSRKRDWLEDQSPEPE